MLKTVDTKPRILNKNPVKCEEPVFMVWLLLNFLADILEISQYVM